MSADALLVDAAEIQGLYATHLDQTGLAQRGGKVLSHCIFSREPLPGNAKVGPAEARLLFALDPLGALDADVQARIHTENTCAVANTSLYPTAESIDRPEKAQTTSDAMLAALSARVQQLKAIDAETLAQAYFGEPLYANVVLLGAALQLGTLPLTREALELSIRKRGVAVDNNLLALQLGRAAIAKPESLQPLLRQAIPMAIGEKIDRTPAEQGLGKRWIHFEAVLGSDEASLSLSEHVATWACDLVDYQDHAYADRYLDTLLPLVERESQVTPQARNLSEVAARELYRVMAYKDEYEVARLLLNGPYRKWLEERSGGNAAVQYQLHPPLLRALGLKSKLSFGKWVEPLLRLLVKGRKYRATLLDLFGRSGVRRTERELITWYSGLIREIADKLDVENQSIAMELLESVSSVRGYEEIKLRAIQKARQQADELRIKL